MSRFMCRMLIFINVGRCNLFVFLPCMHFCHQVRYELLLIVVLDYAFGDIIT